MINVPPPTRVPIGAVTINGKQVEIFLSVEWARYFESLNGQSNTTLQSFNNFATGAFMGLLAEGGDGAESMLPPPGPRGLTGDTGSAGPAVILGDEGGNVEFVPGPTGRSGEQGPPGQAIFMLQDDAGADQMIPFVPDMSHKANLSGAAFTGPVSAAGNYPATYAASARSTAAGNASTSATTNGDNTQYLVSYSGSSADPSPAIWWRSGAALRFALVTNGTTAAGFTQLATLASAGLSLSTGFGCNAKAPQAAVAVDAAATDLSTVINLCNQLRAALIANGIAA